MALPERRCSIRAHGAIELDRHPLPLARQPLTMAMAMSHELARAPQAAWRWVGPRRQGRLGSSALTRTVRNLEAVDGPPFFATSQRPSAGGTLCGERCHVSPAQPLQLPGCRAGSKTDMTKMKWLGLAGVALLGVHCGDDGVRYLTRMAEEAPGANCSEGGQSLGIFYGGDFDVANPLVSVPIMTSCSNLDRAPFANYDPGILSGVIQVWVR